MRIAVYSQFLSSYRSVTIESMAESFGVEQVSVCVVCEILTYYDWIIHLLLL